MARLRSCSILVPLVLLSGCIGRNSLTIYAGSSDPYAAGVSLEVLSQHVPSYDPSVYDDAPAYDDYADYDFADETYAYDYGYEDWDDYA